MNNVSPLLAAILLVLALPHVASGRQAPNDAALGAARIAYDATEYERALRLLDEIVATFGSAPAAAGQVEFVTTVYELRARARAQLRDQEGARADFRSLLLANPAYVLSPAVNPTVRGLFDQVRTRTVGTVDVSVTPADELVTVELDGRRIPATAATFTLISGSHKIVASRTGYASVNQDFYLEAGSAQKLPLILPRVSSTVTLLTSPPNIEVFVNGVSRGKSELDPNAADGGSLVSKPFPVAGLQNGHYRFEFKRECFVEAARELDITQPDDYTPVFNPVKLAPAVASLKVTSTAPGTQIYDNGVLKGVAPLSLNDVCQGSHMLEARTRFGRDLKRVDVKPGQSETFQATIRPAFAIVSDSGASAGIRGGTDFRMAAEEDFRGTSTMMLFAPDDKRSEELRAENNLAVDWLKFNILRQAIDGATKIGEQFRRDIGGILSNTLAAQGLAAVARDPAGDGGDMLLILLAPGSAVPDVVRWRPASQQSVRDAVARLDATPAWLRSSIGLVPIDVLELEGAVVSALESGGSGEAAGIRPGEVITSAGGSPITSASQLLDRLNVHEPGRPLALEVRDAAGAVRKVNVDVRAVPNVVSLDDQSLLSNKLAVDYRYRAAAVADPLNELAVSMNLAAVLIRLGSWSDATVELQRVEKAVGEGRVPVSLTDAITGTTQYLLGLCAEGRRDFLEAERAWTRAAATHGSLLTENGAPVKELAEGKLAQLRASRIGGR